MNGKKLLAVLLCLLMTVGLMPTAVSAADELSAEEMEALFTRFGFAAAVGGGYYAPGTQAPDGTVYYYVKMSGALQDYYNEETWSFHLPYATYIDIVDGFFAHHSDMKNYLTLRDEYDADTDTVVIFDGGLGDAWRWELLSTDTDASSVYLQGVFLHGLPEDVDEDAVEYVDYLTVTAEDENGNPFSYEMPLEACVQLTLAKTDAGYKFDGYEKIAFYEIDNHLYEIFEIESGRVSNVYRRFWVEIGPYTNSVGTSFVCEFPHNSGTWLSEEDMTVSLSVDMADGYLLESFTVTDDDGEHRVEPVANGKHYQIPVGTGSVLITVNAVPLSDLCSTGDLDGDGAVSSSDARIVLQAAVGKAELTEAQREFADVNDDGRVDSSDSRVILQVAVGKATL